MADGKVLIRPAEARDAATIAGLHAASWRASYGGILPDAYLENEAERERASYWARALPGGDYRLVLIAEVKGTPAAFIALKDARDGGYDAVIEHLHATPDMKGMGLGRRLMAQACEVLMASGCSSVCLQVFEANRAAIGFYENLGGVTDAYGTDKFAGSDAPDRRIGWRDLAVLRSACKRGKA